MPRLTEPQQRFIIKCKARGIRDKDIIDALKEEYGKKVDGLTRQHLEIYDPRTAAWNRLGDDLKELFAQERVKADAEENLLPISSRAYRLRVLMDIAEDEQYSDNPFLVAKMMEQAAKEMGGMYNATVTKAAAGSGALSGGTSGVGSGDTERAAELNSLLHTIRDRKNRETSVEGVPGVGAEPGTEGADTKAVQG